MPTKKLIGILVNLFFPGVGTIISGKTKIGVIQLILAIVAFPLSFILIGIPMIIGIWIWSIISVATMDDSEFDKK